MHSVVPFPEAQPTPDRIFAAANAYHTTNALKAAVDLDLFTAIHDGARTPAAIADRLRATERGVRILCDFLVTDGFLTKDAAGYSLAPDAATFLVKSSPAYIGSVFSFLNSRELMQYGERLEKAVRTGVGGEESAVSPENTLWVEFARSMAPLMVMPAEAIAEHLGAAEGKPWKVLDIAAGHGMFGITLARHNPNARIIALDWKAVLEVAQENAGRAGLSERYETLPGSAFDVDFGTGYDVVLLTNFLHHFDAETNVALLKKVRASLKPEGRVATLEFIPNEDRVSPPPAARFALQMLVATAGGDAFTFSELKGMFEQAGFSRSEMHALEGRPFALVISSR
jgi:hypothetical protein